jgi:hypothetical protein
MYRTARRNYQPATEFYAPAKFAGTCAICQKAFNTGDPIYAKQGRDDKWRRYHDECEPKKVQARSRALLAMFTGEMTDTPRNMTGWTDEYQMIVTVTDPAATDDQLRASCDDHRQSSYGALRWNTYDFVQRIAPDKALIAVHEHLCD